MSSLEWSVDLLRVDYGFTHERGFELTTDLHMKEASCNNMTESVVKPGLKKSMGAKSKD